ncbi:aldolase [Cupriavidus sp. TA19]|nr:aldolase [Cupriavidus sp. TA19]
MKIYGESDHCSGLRIPRWDLQGNAVQYGVWASLRDRLAIDLLAAEGFDWVCIDAQHGGAELNELQALIEASHLFSVPAAVRVCGHDTGMVGRVVDAGAAAVIFPTVEDAATASALSAACRFAPRGKRSYGPTRLSPRYPKAVPGNPLDDPLCIMMIETAAGLENLDAILATGPDGVFVGPYDLSLSLGIPLEDLKGGGATGILADIAHRCHRAGVVPGIYSGDAETSRQMVELGYRFMPVASDTAMLAVTAREIIAKVKS